MFEGNFLPQRVLIDTGNESLNRYLGGGFLNSSLNIFERVGLESKDLEYILNSSIISTTLEAKNRIIYVNFDVVKPVAKEQLLRHLPTLKKINCDILKPDINPASSAAKIKIAWRYNASSPSTPSLKENQLDFARLRSFESSDLDLVEVINLKTESTSEIIRIISETVISLTQKNKKTINIIIANVLGPTSFLYGSSLEELCNFFFRLKAISRTVERGMILLCYDQSYLNRDEFCKKMIHNSADSVVAFHAFSKNQAKLLGYGQDVDGILDYIKVPKLNSISFHFQRQVSDWTYRLTRPKYNYRYFVIDQLNLPPCGNEKQDE